MSRQDTPRTTGPACGIDPNAGHLEFVVAGYRGVGTYRFSGLSAPGASAFAAFEPCSGGTDTANCIGNNCTYKGSLTLGDCKG